MQGISLLGTKVLLSCREFCELTGLSLRTITKLVAAREVESIRVGRRRLIPRVALVRFSRRSHSMRIGSKEGGPMRQKSRNSRVKKSSKKSRSPNVRVRSKRKTIRKARPKHRR